MADTTKPQAAQASTGTEILHDTVLLGMLKAMEKAARKMEELKVSTARSDGSRDPSYFTSVISAVSEYEKEKAGILASASPEEVARSRAATEAALNKFWSVLAPSIMAEYQAAHPDKEGIPQDFMLSRMMESDVLTYEEKNRVTISLLDMNMRGIKYVYENAPGIRKEQPQQGEK